MSVRYEPDYEGVGQLMRGDEMQAVMAEAARDVLDRAEAIAPVGQPPHDKHPGMFLAGFGQDVTADGGPAHNRAQGSALNMAEDEPLVDAVDDYHVLARALHL